MATIEIAWLITGISTAAFIVLWFWGARRELRLKRSMLQSAQKQFANIREQYAALDDPNARGVVRRSLDIYRQSVDRYNETLSKPWFFVPGFFMGFHRAKNDVKIKRRTHKPHPRKQRRV